MTKYFDSFPDSYVSSSQRIIPTPSPTAKKTFFYVQETGYLKLKEGHLAKRKKLNSFLFTIILSGSGKLDYLGKSYPLRKGSCFLIDCSHSYLLQTNQNDPWELYWIHFQGGTSKEYVAYFSEVYPVVIQPRNQDEIKNKFRILLNINTNKDSYTEILSSKLILDLITLLLTSKSLTQSSIQPEMEDKLVELKTYLNDHFTEKISLNDLSMQFYISKYHLCHEFKNYFGFTINDYVMEKKIGLAKRLLRFSKKSIGDIAKECGFYDGRYFNKCFKQAEALRPKEYREQWL